MNLQQQLQQLSFEQISSGIISVFPEQEDNLPGYQKMVALLLSLPLKRSENAILVRQLNDKFCGNYLHASLIEVSELCDGSVPKLVNTYALMGEFDWSLLASSEIIYTIEKDTSITQIIAVVLFEMSFLGFEPVHIKDAIKDITSGVNLDGLHDSNV